MSRSGDGPNFNPIGSNGRARRINLWNPPAPEPLRTPVQAYKIESESEADAYLTDLLAKPEYRTMAEVEVRAAKYINNPDLHRYFLNKASEMLQSASEPS